MTAREKIAFQLGLLGIADDQIEANLNAFARELAEQQRAWASDTYDGAGRTNNWTFDTYQGATEAADLIDPEVTR